MRLLLPIDGSDCSQKTLQWVAETFSHADLKCYLLFVIPVLPDLNTLEYDIDDATAMLRKARTELELLGCEVAGTEYVLGDAVSQICRYAEDIKADQVVIGSHGRTGLARLLMGSVSIHVLEHCQCPVTLHRNVEKSPSRGGRRPGNRAAKDNHNLPELVRERTFL